MPKQRNLDNEEELSVCWSICNLAPFYNPHLSGEVGGLSRIYSATLSEIEAEQENFLQPIVFVEECSETTEEQFNELEIRKNEQTK